VTGTTAALTTPTTTTSAITAARPTYLSTMMSTTLTTKFHHSLTQTGNPSLTGCAPHYWWGHGTDCSEVDTTAHTGTSTSKVCPHESFADEKGTTASSYGSHHQLTLGADYEAKIHGNQDTSPHPWHMHTNHVQIYSWTSNGANTFSTTYANYITVGDWRDTIPAMEGVIAVRFHALDFAGEVPIHCHLAHHGDAGMMTTLLISAAASSSSAAAAEFDVSTPEGNGKIAGLAIGLAIFVAGLVVYWVKCRSAKGGGDDDDDDEAPPAKKEDLRIAEPAAAVEGKAEPAAAGAAV
jgi:hypothetical protein